MDLPAWRDLVKEDPFEPDLPIIDPHHHLWNDPPVPEYESYGDEALIADQKAGHNIVASIYIEAQSHYRKTGPEHLRPVGETEYINAVAECASTQEGPGSGACAGIVAHANLLLGAAVDEVLEAHREAAPRRFVGIRHRTSHDPDVPGHSGLRPGVHANPAFREGFARLAPAGLTFDAWVFQSQLGELEDLCRQFEDTAIVIDHLGGPIGVGRNANRPEAFAEWRGDMLRLAAYPNVHVKLGGLNMDFTGLVSADRSRPPTSDEVMQRQRNHILTAIELFGPERCMFESNFPVDMPNVSYVVLWNGFKKIVRDFSDSEKEHLFHGTAARLYGLIDPTSGRPD